MRWTWPLILGCSCLASAEMAQAQTRPPAMTDLGVDLVAVKGGPRLLGIILHRDATGNISIAVQRSWLKRVHSRFYEQQVAAENAERKTALTELQDRIEEWLKRRPDNLDVQEFLRREQLHVREAQDSLESETPDADAPQFIIVVLRSNQVDRVIIQPQTHRQPALVALRERLADIETRTVSSLQAELRKLKIDADKPVDLSDRLPIRRQTDDEWAARMAIVEYQLRKPVDFQGTGDVVVRTGEGAEPTDLGKVITEVLRGQVAAQLAELLEDKPAGGKAKPAAGKWLESAAAIADPEGATGFRVTRVNHDLSRRQVSVETRFVARLPAGKWETVWRHVETVDAAKPRKDLEDQITNDPQVKQALELLKATGLGTGDQIDQAIRFGAATMAAQETAGARFVEFRARYMPRLDGPPLVLNTTP